MSNMYQRNENGITKVSLFSPFSLFVVLKYVSLVCKLYGKNYVMRILELKCFFFNRFLSFLLCKLSNWKTFCHEIIIYINAPPAKVKLL